MEYMDKLKELAEKYKDKPSIYRDLADIWLNVEELSKYVKSDDYNLFGESLFDTGRLCGELRARMPLSDWEPVCDYFSIADLISDIFEAQHKAYL